MLWVILFILLLLALIGVLVWAAYKMLQGKVAMEHIKTVEQIGDRAITAKTEEGRVVARACLTELARVVASSPNPLTRNREIAEHFLGKVDSVIHFGTVEGHMTEEEGREWKEEVSSILYPLMRQRMPGQSK
jgi:hypothetical protein